MPRRHPQSLTEIADFCWGVDLRPNLTGEDEFGGWCLGFGTHFHRTAGLVQKVIDAGVEGVRIPLMEFTEIDREDFRNFLGEIAEAHMPFGKYGPEHFPPRGVPLIDLPPEYLGWFAERGWPRGRLGELMAMVSEIKATGADHVFEPIRRARGGRVSVRKRRPETDF